MVDQIPAFISDPSETQPQTPEPTQVCQQYSSDISDLVNNYTVSEQQAWT